HLRLAPRTRTPQAHLIHVGVEVTRLTFCFAIFAPLRGYEFPKVLPRLPYRPIAEQHMPMDRTAGELARRIVVGISRTNIFIADVSRRQLGQTRRRPRIGISRT